MMEGVSNFRCPFLDKQDIWSEADKFEERVRAHLRRRHKLADRAQGYKHFPRDVIYGRYGLFKLSTKAPWRSAHALV